jgi:UDP-GlcNAc:undecaprenyl-phosphate GlcNAc-1-phosphate transferase
MSILLWLFLFAVYISLVYLWTKRSVDFFIRKKWLTLNYKGESIIQSFGLNIFIHYVVYLICIFIVSYFVNLLYKEAYSIASLLVFLLLGLSLVGWIDDHYGTKDIKGLRGHLAAFFYGKRVTSGLVKAVAGSFISAFVCYSLSASFLECLFYTMVMILSIHVFNLLDVRPGRTIKSFWLLLFVLLPLLSFQHIIVSVLPIVVSTIFLFHYDRRRLAMLGDTGSNVLGGVFGLYVILCPVFEIQLFFFSAFLLLSALSERYSFTAYINKTPWLSKLDNWGIR